MSAYVLPSTEYFGNRDLDAVLREHHASTVPTYKSQGFSFVSKVSVKKSRHLFTALEVGFPDQSFKTVLNPNKGQLGIEIYARDLSDDFKQFLNELVTGR